MVDNNGKQNQKSCLTLILVTPNCVKQPKYMNQHPFINNSNQMNNIANDMVTNQIDKYNELGSLTLNNKNYNDVQLNKRFEPNVLLCDPLSTNESYLPITIVANENILDTNQHSSDILLNARPKYCCTLEVKFIRYADYPVYYNFKYIFSLFDYFFFLNFILFHYYQ